MNQAGDMLLCLRGRRYSNFGYYVDRVSGEFLIMAAEEPQTTWDHPEADCYRWRVMLDQSK